MIPKDLNGIESKLETVESAERDVSLRISDIANYANACRKIKESIENHKPDTVLCAVPQAYHIGKIVRGIGFEKPIKMLPYPADEKRSYNAIKDIIHQTRKNSIKVAVIDFSGQASDYIELFTTALKEDIMERNWDECSLELSVENLAMAERPVMEQFSESDYEINANEKSTILFSDIKINHIPFSNQTENRYLVGAKYNAETGLKKIGCAGKLNIYDEKGLRRIIQLRSTRDETIHDLFVRQVIDCGKK